MKALKRIGILFVIICLSIPTFAMEDETISHRINVEMVNYNVPGVGVTLVQDGETVFKSAFGEDNAISKTPMDTALSVVQVGSVSKVMTTYALLDLLEDEKISYDTKIQAYLPDYLASNTYISSLTFKNLLTHTTGIATLKADSATQDDPLKTMKLSFGEQAKIFFETYKLKPVVEKDNYTIFSNVGYILAGVLIESISGERYEYYMSNHVFSDLNMETTSEIMSGRNPFGVRLTQNYSVYGGQRTPLWTFNTKYLPSEDLLTTVDDMEQVLKFFTSDTMNENIKKAMFSKQISNNLLIQGRSFGFSVLKYGGYEAYLHDGGIPGENARLLVIPELKLAMFLTYNSNSLEAREALTDAVLADVIQDQNGELQHETYLIEDLEKFNGAYSPVNASNETMEQLTRIIHQIRITDTAEGIRIDDVTYVPISETIFYSSENQSYAEFRTDEDGQLEYLIIGNAIYERTPLFQSIILLAALLVMMGLSNIVALLLLLTRWSNMKVNRIHDTPRMVLLLHTLAVSGVLIFILIISSTYEIWDVIYGVNSAINGTRFFGYATLLLSIPSFIMIGRAKQDYRWSPFMISVFQTQIILGFLLVIWMMAYNLI